MVDVTIPAESRLSMYVSARYLQELEIALRLAGIPTRYERPGMGGVIVPRLRVEHRDHGELDEVICAVPRALDPRRPAPDVPGPEWWFMWWLRHKGTRAPVCPAVDMNEAARLIALRLREGTR